MLLLENESDEETTFNEYLRSIYTMPRWMRMLWLTNLLSYMAFVSYCLYFTDFVGEAVFMGDPMVRSKHLRCFLLYFPSRLYFSGATRHRKFRTLSNWSSFRMLGSGCVRSVLFAILNGHRKFDKFSWVSGLPFYQFQYKHLMTRNIHL